MKYSHKKREKKLRIMVLAAVPLALMGLVGAASATGVSTNTSGSGAVNESNPYNAGPPPVTATWSETDVSNSGQFFKIVNATITTTGIYGWHQTYTLTEKQRESRGPVTVTGNATLSTPYGSFSEPITPLTLTTGFDIPFSGNGSVATENTSQVGADLFNTEYDIVYNQAPPGVNADYWFGN